MEKTVIFKEIDELISFGVSLKTKKQTGSMGWEYVPPDIYNSWRTKCLSFLSLVLQPENEYRKLIEEQRESGFEEICICIQTLENVKEYVGKGFLDTNGNNNINVDDVIETIFTRFHKVARQLRNRYNQRPTLDINDEYDVQNLLHALLQLYFDDIRAEEWTPSYAGKCARVDFLLKNEKMVIEVKKARQGLTDKEIGDQLIIDIDRYKTHYDCEKLVCFVYDPEGRIGNPIGIMEDLNKQHDGFAKVYIRPLI